MRVGYEPTNIRCFKKIRLNGVKYECQRDDNFKLFTYVTQ